MLTVITYAFALLVSALTIFAGFLIWLLCITKELKRYTEVRYPGWKVYIDVAVIAVGFVALWVMVLLGYQGWMTLSCAVHKLTVYFGILVRWPPRADLVQS